MSRDRTRGRPKPRRVAAQRTATQRTRFFDRTLTRVTAGVCALAVLGGVAAVVILADSSSPARHSSTEPVYAVVGGQKLTRKWYRSVLRVERLEIVAEIQNARQTGNEGILVRQLQRQEELLPKTVFKNMIGNIVIEQHGQMVGAKTSTYDEFSFLNAFTQQQFGGQITNLIKAARLRGLTVIEYRQFLLMLDYNFQALGTALAAHLPRTGVVVHVRGLVISLPKPDRSRYSTEAAFRSSQRRYQRQLAAIRTDARTAKRFLTAGRDWREVAASSFPVGARFTDLGWRWIKSLPSPLRDAAKSLPAISTGVVVSPYGVEVMQVLGHRIGKLSATQRLAEQDSAIKLWLRKQEAKKGYVVRYFVPR